MGGYKILHEAIRQFKQASDDMAKGNVDKYRNGHPLVDFSKLGTNKGELMGSHTMLLSDGKVNPFHALHVPELKRINEYSINAGAALKAAAWGYLATVGWGFVIGVPLVLTGVGAIGGGVGYSVGNLAAIGLGVRSGVKSYADDQNGSSKTSVATFQELKKVANQAYEISNTLMSNLDEVGIDDKINAITDKQARSAMEAAWGRIVKIADALYEQAIYDTVMVAQLLEKVVK